MLYIQYSSKLCSLWYSTVLCGLQCFFKKDNDFLQRSRVFHAGDFLAVGLEHQCIGLVALHLESCHKRGPSIFRVQVSYNELIGQFCELPVRVRVLLEDPAMHASERVV